MWSNLTLEFLKDKTIKAAFIHRGDLYLQLNDSVLKLQPNGDCCSNCYIQHVSGTQALIGGTVESIESIESEPTEEELKNADVLDSWGHRFRIAGKGIFDIEMRLDHNGYYGGSLDVENVESIPEDAQKLEDF